MSLSSYRQTMSKLIALSFVVAFAGLHGVVEGAPFYPRGFVPTLPFFPASNGIPQTNNEMVQMANFLAAVSEKIDKGEIQSNDQVGKLFTSFVGSLLSAAEKKIDPNDEFAKTLLNGFQSMNSLIGNSFGEAQTESLTNEKLSDEAEEQFANWGQFVAPLVKQLITKAIEGSSTNAEMEVIRRLPEEAKAQLWGKLLTGLATNLLSRAISGGSMAETAATMEALPEEAKEQLLGTLLGSLASQLVANKLGDMFSG